MIKYLPEITVDPQQIRTVPQARGIIGDLLNAIEKLVKTVHQLSNEIETLKEELRRQKKQSKPPDLFTPKAERKQNYSSRERTKQERLPWHKSIKRPRLTINREEQLPEVSVCQCGSMRFRVIRTWNKIVQGLIIKRDTVQYNGRDKQCTNCGIIFASTIPEDIKGRTFSSELRSWVSVFKYDCRMSEMLIYRLFTGLAIVISHGQINEILLENSGKLAGSYTHLRVWGQKLSRYLHSDATGFFRRMKGGKILKEHLHFVGHELLSIFTITSKYNSLLLATEVLTRRAMRTIIYISDDGSANGRKLLIVLKQLCWVHEIRHYLKLAPQAKMHQNQVNRVIDELWEWYMQAKKYGRDPTARVKQELAEEFDRIMGQTTGYAELDNRLRLTGRKRKRLLLFLDHPGIPIENNLAERDLRPAILMRKLTGGTRSQEGNRSFERHMSVIQTARKQGLHVFNTVHGLLSGTLSPFILTEKTLPAVAI